MGLQVDVVFLVLLHDQITQMVLVIDDLEDLPIPRENEVGPIIGDDGLSRLLFLPAFNVNAGIGGGILIVAAFGCHKACLKERGEGRPAPYIYTACQ